MDLSNVGQKIEPELFADFIDRITSFPAYFTCPKCQQNEIRLDPDGAIGTVLGYCNNCRIYCDIFQILAFVLENQYTSVADAINICDLYGIINKLYLTKLRKYANNLDQAIKINVFLKKKINELKSSDRLSKFLRFLQLFGFPANEELIDLFVPYEIFDSIIPKYAINEVSLIAPLYSSPNVICGIAAFTGDKEKVHYPLPFNTNRFYGFANPYLLHFRPTLKILDDILFITRNLEQWIILQKNGITKYGSLIPIAYVPPIPITYRWLSYHYYQIYPIYNKKVIAIKTGPLTSFDVLMYQWLNPLVLEINEQNLSIRSLLRFNKAKDWMMLLLEEYKKTKNKEIFESLRSLLGTNNLLKLILKTEANTFNIHSVIEGISIPDNKTIFHRNKIFHIKNCKILYNDGGIATTYLPIVKAIVGNQYIVDVHHAIHRKFTISVHESSFFLNLHNSILSAVDEEHRKLFICTKALKRGLAELALRYSEPEILKGLPSFCSRGLRLQDQIITKEGKIEAMPFINSLYGKIRAIDPVVRCSREIQLIANFLAKLVVFNYHCKYYPPSFIVADSNTEKILRFCLNKIDAPILYYDNFKHRLNYLETIRSTIDWPIGLHTKIDDPLDLRIFVDRFRGLILLEPSLINYIWKMPIMGIKITVNVKLNKLQQFDQIFLAEIARLMKIKKFSRLPATYFSTKTSKAIIAAGPLLPAENIKRRKANFLRAKLITDFCPFESEKQYLTVVVKYNPNKKD